MELAEILDRLLVYREQRYDSRQLTPQGWSKFTLKTGFNWLRDQAGLYSTSTLNPLSPTLIYPTGKKTTINVNCTIAKKLYTAQQVIPDYSDCHTLNEHTTKWHTTEAVKRTVESYKIKDAFTFIFAIESALLSASKVSKTPDSMRVWADILPFLEGVNRFSMYSTFPEIESSLQFDNCRDMDAEELLRYFWIR